MKTRLVIGWCALGVVVGLACGVALSQGARKVSDDSPHVTALQVLFGSKMSEIRAVDKGDRWLDTKRREWVVKRPFGPGRFDSTHWFEVTYRIDGQQVASWFVDTRTGKVQVGAFSK